MRGRMMTSKRCPHLIPGTRGICYVTYRKDFTAMIKGLEMGDFLDQPCEPSVIIGVLKRGRQEDQNQKEFRDAVLLALKMKEGIVSQEMQTAPINWRRQGTTFSQSPQKECSPVATLI